MNTDSELRRELREKVAPAAQKKKKQRWPLVVLLVLAGIVLVCGIALLLRSCLAESPVTVGSELTEGVQLCYCAGLEQEVPVYNKLGNATGTRIRGEEVTVDFGSPLELEDCTLYPVKGSDTDFFKRENLSATLEGVVPEGEIWVKTTMNLRTGADSLELYALAMKGAKLTVIGYQGLHEDGSVDMYQVQHDKIIGWLSPIYLTTDEKLSRSHYEDGGMVANHLARGDLYGGGTAATLDYFPREKLQSESNVMPEHCYCLYLNCFPETINTVDDYIAYAKTTNINTFVVNILDGTAVGYASDVMRKYCPSAAGNAGNETADYQAAIKKIKDAGFFVVGRMTVFNDAFFAFDHPEYAIADAQGKPLEISGMYWPSGFSRVAWQYKVELAIEAVELMGFDEIQFDYVRFPDGTYSFEKDNNINYQNVYNETKAEANQRFLMYACDEIHKAGAYVSADVFGETSNPYVASYGQYFPAVSNVVDVISGMPYCDHYESWGDYVPWLQPYECVNTWAEGVVARQSEIPTPAIVRTWIQAYDAIRPPYNTYGAEEIWAEISALLDNGLDGGFIPWNAGSSLSKYQSFKEAFDKLEK